MSYAQCFLTKLKKAGRADKKTQNRPQVRFGRLPKATYRPPIDRSGLCSIGLTGLGLTLSHSASLHLGEQTFRLWGQG